MDGQDHRKTSPSSGHENQEVHLCHKCGWPFPNPHPSAKHRRAHKRICGTVEGYKLIDPGQHANSGVSDDEHDDDPLTPSPKTGKKTGDNEIVTVGFAERSNRSEDDVFSDAVTEFSDGGFTSVSEGRLECATVSDKNEEKVTKADDATADRSSQMHKPKAIETPLNLLETTTSSESIVSGSNYEPVLSSDNSTEELVVGLRKATDSASDLPPNSPGTFINAPREYVKADAGDLMQYSTSGVEQETNIEENEEHSTKITPSDVAETPSEIPINAGTFIYAPGEHVKANVGDLMQYRGSGVEQETNIEENEESSVKEALSYVAVTPSRIASESSEVISNFGVMDPKTLDSGSADRVGESKEEHHESGLTLSLHNLSPEVQSLKLIETLASNAELEPDCAQAMDVISCVNSDEDPKDNEAVKGNLPATVESCEIIEPVINTDRSTVHEENCSSFHSSMLGASSENCTFNATGAPQSKTWNGTQEIQTDFCIQEQHPRDSGNGLSSVTSKDDKVIHTTNLSTGNGADDPNDKAKKCDTDVPDSKEVTEEEPSTNIKAASESAENRSAVEAGILGAGNNSGRDMAITGTSDLSGNEDRDVALGVKPEMSSEMTLLSTCRLSEPKAAEDEGMDKVVSNLQENETATYVVLDSSEVVGPNSSNKEVAVPTHSGSQNCETEDSQEATKEPNLSSKNEVLVGMFDASRSAVKLSHDGDAITSQGIPENPAEHSAEDSQEATKESNLSSKTEVLVGNFDASHTAARLNHDGDAKIIPENPSENSAEDSQEATKESNLSSKSEVLVGIFYPSRSAVKLNHDGDAKIIPENPSELSAKDSQGATKESNFSSKNELLVGIFDPSRSAVKLNHDGDAKMSRGIPENHPEQSAEDSQEATKEPNLSSKNEVLVGIFDASRTAAVKLNHRGDAKISQGIPENPSEQSATESESAEKNYTAVEGGQIGDSNMVHLQEEGDENPTKPNEVTAVAVSIDSNSQTDGLGGSWGSVSGPIVSTQSDATAVNAEYSPPTDSQALEQSVTVNLQKPQASSAGHHSSKSDVFDPPSFMTLIEAESRVDQESPSDIVMEPDAQQPKSDPLQTAWFPSLTDVVNESQGRKKNEEIIAKVTNWTTGKQHTPLQSLLGEAETPTMVKKDENTTKNVESPARKKDEKPTKNHQNLAKTVSSLQGSEEPAKPSAKSGVTAEWNSPARYPNDRKKDKRKVKGRPYWVPFVCCSSIP
ncbi:uncharacterized protein LOC127812039 isoform X2 [Diospyros lotus]|uniref:uncharacterized protein LOC127812039 isoform X2 n=1 Tax=Diospyros lotus TaxID=55363 RepID=UPI002256BADC|nr:uncharacterized protein LOC127812039 isoform X2 [Diospyros lotus]